MGSGYFDVDSIFTFEHFHNNDIFEKNQAIKSTTISCMRNHNRKVLILPMDRFTQELNISYCVPLVSRIANNKSHDLTKRIQEPSKNEILLHQSFPSDRSFRVGSRRLFFSVFTSVYYYFSHSPTFVFG